MVLAPSAAFVGREGQAEVPALFARLFDLFDSDSSGGLDLRELLCGLQRLHPSTTPTARARILFDLLDCDHDGFLTREDVSLLAKSWFRMVQLRGQRQIPENAATGVCLFHLGPRYYMTDDVLFCEVTRGCSER